MRLIFETGDKVVIKEDWRKWNKGDKAKVVGVESDRGLAGVYVILSAISNKVAEKDCSTLYAYQVEIDN